MTPLRIVAIVGAYIAIGLLILGLAAADKINWLYPPLPVVVWSISVAVEYYELKQRGVK